MALGQTVRENGSLSEAGGTPSLPGPRPGVLQQGCPLRSAPLSLLKAGRARAGQKLGGACGALGAGAAVPCPGLSSLGSPRLRSPGAALDPRSTFAPGVEDKWFLRQGPCERVVDDSLSWVLRTWDWGASGEGRGVTCSGREAQTVRRNLELGPEPREA